MPARAPRGPRPSVKQATPVEPKSEVPAGTIVTSHGAIEIVGDPVTPSPTVPVEATYGEYDGLVLTCRKPFKLCGEKYSKGDPVPVEKIPRWESWIRTGYLEEAKAS